MSSMMSSSADLSTSEMLRAVTALFVSIRLATRGLERGSLSPTGAVAAFAVGLLSCGASYRFGATLIAFYLAGTTATRFRAERKSKIEDGHRGALGQRSAGQVLASSAPAVVASSVYAWLFRYDAPVLPAFPLRSSLNLFYLLFFAACAGDTFASELGIVLPRPGAEPVLIIAPWRRVPPGTNGGVSWQGTFASGLGGLLMGCVYYALSPDHGRDQLALILVGLIGGLVGSMLDSVLGAILQLSIQDTDTGKVLAVTPCPSSSGGSSSPKRSQYICGADILSGEAVNALAGILTGALAPVLLPMLF
jgi:uncharacterized protein (TIGR00297 family)